jgi:TatD DNase family protein
MLIDSHCHLDFPDLAERLPSVLDAARAAGVGRLVTISTWTGQAARYRALAEAHPDVYFTVGTHPHNAAEEADVTVDEILAQTGHPRCVAVGEAGLDFHYDRAPRDLQERVFRVHIAAARETALPLVIHARNADSDMERILVDEMGRGRFDAVLHCFSSGERLARLGVELGLYLSFSGIITFVPRPSSDASRHRSRTTGSSWRRTPPILRRCPVADAPTNRPSSSTPQPFWPGCSGSASRRLHA